MFVGHGVDAGAAGEHIGAGIAFQRVVERRAGEVLDADEGVALGIAATAQPRHQADADAGARGRIARCIDARAAVHAVGAGKTGQKVVAGVAVERVVERRAGEILDTDEGVAFGIAAAAQPRHQADADAGARGRIARRVDAGAAVHAVGAGKTGQKVVAGIADEHVGERIAGAIDGGGSQQGEVLDIADGVHAIGEAEADRGLHRVGAIAAALLDHVADVVDHVGVVAQSAEHTVGADAAVQRVVAGETPQGIGASSLRSACR